MLLNNKLVNYRKILMILRENRINCILKMKNWSN